MRIYPVSTKNLMSEEVLYFNLTQPSPYYVRGLLNSPAKVTNIPNGNNVPKYLLCYEYRLNFTAVYCHLSNLFNTDFLPSNYFLKTLI